MTPKRKNLDNTTISTPAKIQRNSFESGTPPNQFTNSHSALKGNTPRCAAKGKAPLKFSLASSSNILDNQLNEMEIDVKPSKQDLDSIMNEMDEILKEPCIGDENQIEQKVFQEKSCQTEPEFNINTEEDETNLQHLTPLEHHQAVKLKNYRESFETMKSCMLTESRELAETKRELDRLKAELQKESTNHKETKLTIEMLQREKLEAKKKLDEKKDKLTNCQIELNNLSEEYKKTKHSLEILTQNLTEKLNRQVTEHKETQHSLDTLKSVSLIDKKQLEETKKELENLKVEKSKETRELNARIQIEKSDRSHDLERLHQLEKELSEERKEHSENKQILDRLYNEKVSLNKEFTNVKAALDKLNEEKMKEKQELLDTKGSVNRMMIRQWSKEKQHLIDTSNSVIESLKAENKKLMDKLEETKNSVKDERVNRSQGSEETIDHLKSQFLQRGHELQEQKTAIGRLKLNILTLMKLIVPDYEYGDPEDIENVILEFITANNDQSGSGDGQ
jgi:chromosome segregation ATPase